MGGGNYTEPRADNPGGRIIPPAPGGKVMQQARVVGHGQPYRSVILAAGLVLLATGCAHVGECNPTDNTVSCCLKEHPGEYERCAAVAPPTQQSQPSQLLPGRSEAALPEADAAPIPDLPTLDEKEKWRDICMDHYMKCRSGRHDGRVWGESQCKACYEACMRHGFWPLRANEKPCPGA